MPLSHDIVLRPRFKIIINRHSEMVLNAFQDAKTQQSDFIIIRSEGHIFIRLPKDRVTFWSPQLHLEIYSEDDNSSIIKGLFGPNPAVWTLFMFMHFLVAGLFLAFGIWTYTNWSLEHPFDIQAGLTILMILAWVALYFLGRLGKSASHDDMHALHDFMNRIIDE